MAMDVYDLLGVPPTGFHSSPFVTSWCLPLWLLAIIRLVLSIYCFTTIIFAFNWFAHHTVIFHLQDVDTKAIVFPVGSEGIRQSFSYFTYLSYWGLAFYFFFASMHTFVFARRGYTWLDCWPRWLQAMHTTYYSTVVCFPYLISTVYWGSMWTRVWWRDDFSQWSMISMHAMNSVFATFEIVATQTRPLPYAHLGIMWLIMSLYLGVAYITKASAGIFVYLWLDPKNGVVKLLLHMVGYAALLSAYFVLVRSVILLRSRWFGVATNVPSLSMGDERASRVERDNFWTYERYEAAMLDEEREKRLRIPSTNLTKPETAVLRRNSECWPLPPSPASQYSYESDLKGSVKDDMV